MIDAIETLREEHNNIEMLLRILQREVDVFARGDRPNYELILAVIDYFKDYPDRCHHPKENLIFAKLKLRDPLAVAKIGDLEAEHREESVRLQRVAEMIERVLNEEDLTRQSVTDTIRDFIDREREHLAKEENLMFPAALDALRSEDWAEIALQLADRYDPLLGGGLEEKYALLRQNILEWESESSTKRPR
jgi:hemerythrin-like domain-containing protein